MEIKTHEKIDQGLCGKPVLTAAGTCRVELPTRPCMAVDDRGLIHGGFVFGLADHAAMLAVNHPCVVLGSADVKFLKPVRTGEVLIAEARVEVRSGRKHTVAVTVQNADATVFKGLFNCFVLEKHVLA